MKTKIILAISLLIMIVGLTVKPTHAQQAVKLDLKQAIELAADSSLSAFRYKNLYEANYWSFRSYKAQRLPSLSLNLTPARYYRDFTSRYDFENNIDVYRSQQTYYASMSLNLSQNFDWLGGTFFVESDLDYMRSHGVTTYTQLSSIPVRIGYQQQLLGYNPFKWEKKIEPLRYEKAKKEFLYNMEGLSEEAVNNYFNLVLAQTEYRLALQNLQSADTLYILGERKFNIASISNAELLTLKLGLVNAKNSLENNRISLRRANANLATFLGLDQSCEIEVEIPSIPKLQAISAAEALQYARANNPSILRQQVSVIEAEREVNMRKIENLFNVSFNASIGFNQVGNNLSSVYSNLMRQELVSVSLSIPLLDWGVRKGRYKMAVNNLEVEKTAQRQEVQSVEEDVLLTVDDFNIQINMIQSAQEAMDLADMAFDQTRKRFMIGQSDINSMTLATARREEANRNYIYALRNYWLSYFKLRKLTLFDFENQLSLSRKFDLDNKVK